MKVKIMNNMQTSSKSSSTRLTAEQKARRAERTTPQGFHRGTEVVFDEQALSQAHAQSKYPHFRAGVTYTVISVFGPTLTASGNFEVTLREGYGDVYGYVQAADLKRADGRVNTVKVPSWDPDVSGEAHARLPAAKKPAAKKAVPVVKKTPAKKVAAPAVEQAEQPQQAPDSEVQTPDVVQPSATEGVNGDANT